ncbi:fimbrial protein [Serratia sp. PAMC26656]|uniref:fimbrial protein n=1 Tax=Serratia sp. PAMC26656 TaxID=2775909 RepID=UPI0018F6776F|nr:fimbrial protein [Serratia sp. PAMC26656]MBJ7893509.1 fimbrial protein [Serratia sp. PAMC26656]
MRKKNYSIFESLLISGAMFSAVIFSASSRADTTINITGTVIAPLSCVINGNQAIAVDFGNDLITTRVDGSNYMKTVDYTLVCKNNTSNAIKMKIEGSATSFNQSALQTDQADLGIELRADGQRFPINSWLNFTYPNKPLMQAVPVKRAGGALKVGAFSVAATLMVDYQ